MRDLSLHLMDILQNSITARSSHICILIEADKRRDTLVMTISDNGTGMDDKLLKKVMDPFATSRKTRKVGLGIPLLAASCDRSSGNLSVQSAKGVGTTLTASFKLSHIDRPPLGSIAETLVTVISGNPEVELELKLSSLYNNFCFDSNVIKQKIGEVPITHYEILSWIKEYINEGVNITFGGVLDEIYS